MKSLRAFVRAASGAVGLGLIAGCAAATSESTSGEGASAAAESALATLHCPAGYELITVQPGDPLVNGKSQYCAFVGGAGFSITTVTQPLPAGTFIPTSTCPLGDVAIPPALSGLGCTLGRYDAGRVIFACPSPLPPNTQLPATLGLDLFNGAPLPACPGKVTVSGSGPSTMWECEETMSLAGLPVTLDCFGEPLPGWQLVLDGVVQSQATNWEPDSCKGMCACTTLGRCGVIDLPQ